MEWIGVSVVALFSALLSVAIGVWALRRKTPMHFWSGTTVEPESISNIKEYNAENAIMWFKYSIPFVISAIVAPFHMNAAAIIIAVGCTAGIPWLIVTYKIIEKKYKA
jgi:hypothetical protein